MSVHVYVLRDGDGVQVHGSGGDGPFAKRKKLLHELAFGSVPMVQEARLSVKVHFVRDALVLTHVDNRPPRTALVAALSGRDASLLREWSALHGVCKQALAAVVRRRGDADGCVDALKALLWAHDARIVVDVGMAPTEVFDDAPLCARVARAVLLSASQPVVWLKRGGTGLVAALAPLLRALGLLDATLFVGAEPAPPRALRNVIAVPDDVAALRVAPLLEAAVLGGGGGDGAFALRALATALLQQCARRASLLATDVLVDAARLVQDPDDLIIVLAVARRMVGGVCGGDADDTRDAIDACIDICDVNT